MKFSLPSKEKEIAISTGTDGKNSPENLPFLAVQKNILVNSDEQTNRDNDSKTAVVERARQDSNLQPSDSKSEAVNPQDSPNKALTKSGQSVLASCLAQIVQKYPDLVRLIQAWPELPGHIKAAIKALIQSHIQGVKK